MAEFVEEVFEATKCVAGEVWRWTVAGVWLWFAGRLAIGSRNGAGLGRWEWGVTFAEPGRRIW